MLEAPSDKQRRVLLIDAQEPIARVQLLDVPLGLLQLGAAVRAYCHEVDHRILDWNTFARTEREARFLEVLEEYQPAIVGISAFSFAMPLAIRIARMVRAHDPRVPIVLGGHHATANPAGIEKYAELDYYVVGDGVAPGPALFSPLLDGTGTLEEIASVAFRRGAEVLHTKPQANYGNPLNIRLRGEKFEIKGPSALPASLDGVPTVDWGDLDLTPYKGNNSSRSGEFIYHFGQGEWAPFLATQGCIYRCSFCELTSGRDFRRYSPGRVVDELRRLTDVHQTKHVFLYDNLIHLDKEWFGEVLGRIERELDLNFIVLAMADRLERDLIDRMLGAGMRYLACFPESGSDRIRHLMRKPIKMERLLSNMEYASDQGAVISCSVIMGWPTETVAEAEESLKLAGAPFIDVTLCNQLIYFGGAELAKYLASRGIEIDSEAYFEHVNDPGKLCLADYDLETYNKLARRGKDLNIEKLRRPRTIEKLAAMGMRVEYVSRDTEDPDIPVDDATSKLLSEVVDLLGDSLVGEGLAIEGCRVKQGPWRSQELLLKVDDGSLEGRIGLRRRDDARPSFIRTDRFDVWYENDSTLPSKRLVAIASVLAGRLGSGAAATR